jgi:hypothetical protein
MDEKKRIAENKRIIEKMKRGESIATIPTEATWYPPRPLIVKDLTKLYPQLIKENSKSFLTLVEEEHDKT